MVKYLYFVTECVHAVKDVLWEDNKLCRLSVRTSHGIWLCKMFMFQSCLAAAYKH